MYFLKLKFKQHKNFNKMERLLTTVQLHWWNFGKKKLDFSGTLSDCLESKGIKMKSITHPKLSDVTSFRFKFSLSSTNITHDVYSTSAERSALDTVKLFLTILGDKAITQSRYGTMRINH